MEFKEQLIFSKKLKSSHVDHQLNMPKDSIQNFLKVAEGEKRTVIQAVDTTGELWTFRYLTRNKGQYLKPYLSMGWKDFVQKKGLRVGDMITFYKLSNPEGEVRYMIKAERDEPMMVFGARIGTTRRDIN